MMRKICRSVFVALAASTALMNSPLVCSQESAQTSPLEEVVVTARFRKESVQNIGASVSTLGAEQLEASGIRDFSDIVSRTPGVSLRYGGPDQNDIAIRGISRSIDPIVAGLTGSSPLVAVYLDDIPIGTPSVRDLDINLFDMSRVEIIRGPQPTFFGEGAVGGVVRYISNAPTLEAGARLLHLGATLSATYAGGANDLVEAAADATLVPERLGIRASGYWRQESGYIDNVELGTKDVNGYDTAGGHISARLKVTEQLSIDAFSSFGSESVKDPFFVDGGSPDPKRLTKSAPLDSRGVDDDFTLFGAKAEYQGKAGTFSSITGLYQRTMDSDIWDPTQAGIFNLLPFLGIPAPAGDFTAPISQKIRDHNFTEELRFVSKFNAPVDVTAGLFYKDSDYGQDGGLYLYPSGLVVIPLVRHQNRTQYAGFAELTWHVNNALRVIGGARYVDEKLDQDVPAATLAFITARLPDITQNDFLFHLKKSLPRISLEWQAAANVLAYTSFAQGVRNGGLNNPTAAAGAVAPGDSEGFRKFLFFGEDSVDAYEIGIKSAWPSHGLTLNGAVFYNKYKDPQVLYQSPLAGTLAGPDATSKGVEIEILSKATGFVTLFGAFTYTDAEFDESSATASIEKGNKLANVPEIAYSVGVDVVFPTHWPNVRLLGTIDFNYTGERYTSQVGGPYRKASSLELLNGRFGVEYRNWKLTAFVSNALNDIESTGQFQSVLDSAGDFPAVASGLNQPRTVGLRLLCDF
jgi:iron complex outermembrane recepter protein